MLRVATLIAILTLACSDMSTQPDAATHDAEHADAERADAPGSGSGSDAFASLDAHPHDRSLEMLVVGMCAIVVASPVGGSRRRRRARANS